MAHGGGELSPRAHARIRLHLALIAGLPQPGLEPGRSGAAAASRPGSEAYARDFAAIAYIPGVIANLGDASLLYDSARRDDMLRALLPNGLQVRYPPFYGPQISVFFSAV